jgi:thiol:disulfide interchange protein DsbA
MRFDRRHFVVAALLSLSALSAGSPALAQSEGSDYTLISPAQPTDDSGKIEVLEFFSYGCPHCSDFHPLVSAWAARLPSDVSFRRVPVTFGRASWANIAKLYFTLETTGDLARLDNEIFKAIHGERINLFDERTLTEWVVKKGVDPKRFSETFNSFGVMSKLKRSEQLGVGHKIQGVPAITVNGKYLVGGKDFTDQLAITDKLIAKVRNEKSAKK